MITKALPKVLGGLGLILLAGLVFGWWGSWSSPPPAELGREHRETPSRLEPSTEAARMEDGRPRGVLRVEAQVAVGGSVPVAVADSTEILFIQLVAIGGEVDLRGRIPEDRSIVLCPIDNLSGSKAIADLAAECVLPRPVVVREGQWPQDVSVEFARPVAASRIRIVARTAADEPCEGVRFRIAPVSEFTSAELPVAFIATEEDGFAVSPALAPGKYRVSLQKVPDSFSPLAEEPADVVLTEEGLTDARFVFAATCSLRGVVHLEAPQPCGLAVYKLDSAPPFIRGLTVDETGEFEIGALPPGRYAAVSWPDGHMESSVEFELALGRRAEIVLTPRPADEGAELVARLVDASGAPVRSRVNLNRDLRPGEVPGGKGCRLEAEGVLRMTGVSGGPKVLIWWDLGLLRRVTLPEEPGRIDLGTLRLPPPSEGVRLEGRVVDDRGVLLPGGTIVCLAPATGDGTWIRFAETDGGGSYRFEHVPPGAWELWWQPMGRTNYVGWEDPKTILIGDDDAHEDLKLTRRRP